MGKITDELGIEVDEEIARLATDPKGQTLENFLEYREQRKAKLKEKEEKAAEKKKQDDKLFGIF